VCRHRTREIGTRAFRWMRGGGARPRIRDDVLPGLAQRLPQEVGIDSSPIALLFDTRPGSPVLVSGSAARAVDARARSNNQQFNHSHVALACPDGSEDLENDSRAIRRDFARPVAAPGRATFAGAEVRLLDGLRPGANSSPRPWPAPCGRTIETR